MVERIAEGIWGVPGELKLAPGFYFPLRSPVLRVGAGTDLLIYSPVRFDDATAAALDGLGRVRWIVAPNGVHHLFARRAAERWPDATVLASAAVRKKQPELRATWLDEATAATLPSEVDALPIEGMPYVQEWVLLHRPSRSLVVCDLVFNMRETKGALTALFAKVMANAPGLRHSRTIQLVTRDRVAAARSVRVMLERWDFDRVVMTHGEVLEGPGGEAKRALEAALAPLLSM